MRSVRGFVTGAYQFVPKGGVLMRGLSGCGAFVGAARSICTPCAGRAREARAMRPSAAIRRAGGPPPSAIDESFVPCLRCAPPESAPIQEPHADQALALVLRAAQRRGR